MKICYQTFSFILLWLWSSFAIAKPQFEDIILESRLVKTEFYQQYKKELFDFNRSLFLEVKSCYSQLSKKNQLTVEKHLELLNFKISYGNSEYTLYKLVEIFSHPVPIEIYAAIGNILLQAQTETSNLCRNKINKSIGSGEIDFLFQTFKDILTDRMKRKSLQALYYAFQYSPTLLIKKALANVVNLMPEEFSIKLNFIKNQWFIDFLKIIIRDPKRNKAIEFVLFEDVNKVKLLLDKAIKVLSPYEINYPELLNSNQKYPFVEYLAYDFWQKLTLDCSSKLSSQLINTSFDIETEKLIFHSLLEQTLESCPELNHRQAIGLLNVEDRMTSWLLPRSVTLYFLKQVWQHVKINYDAKKIQFTEIKISTDNLFEAFNGIEKLSFWHKMNTSDTSLNHYVTPYFLSYSLKKLFKSKDNEIYSVTFLAGIVYQLYDLENKINQFQMDPKDGITGSLEDLSLWELGIEDAFKLPELNM